MLKSVEKLLDIRAGAIAMAFTLLFSSLFLNSAKLITAAPGSGAIWTTNGSCGNPQDVNHYGTGEHVFIKGDNFDSGTYSWTIIGQPGQASGDPHITVASGTVVIDQSGTFCIDSYVINSDDWGEYTVDVNDGHGQGKNDNYQANVAVGVATPTATATATATATPTITPTATATVLAAATSAPTPPTCASDEHLNLQGDKCLKWELGGAPTPNGSSNGQVLGASTSKDPGDPKGQVLGASTLGATGSAVDNLGLLLIAVGSTFAVTSFYGAYSILEETRKS